MKNNGTIRNLGRSLGLAIILLAVFFPISTLKAATFNPMNPLDPFCLFSCPKSQPQNVTNYTDSNNVINSNNVNSTVNGSVNSASGQGSYISAPAVYAPTATTPAPTIINNNNNNNNTAPASSPAVYVPSPAVYVPTPVVYPTPVYYNPRPYYDYNNYPTYSYSTPYYNNTPYYGNNYSNYYSQLYVSCQPNTSFSPVGSVVTWQAYASGGSGSYSYSWSGTDNIYGSQNSIYTTYYNPGIKYATVTVYSNGQQTTVQCSSTITVGAPIAYNNYPNYPYTNSIQIACFADPTTIRVGNSVTWSAEAAGANGNYFTYSWSGSEGLYGSQSSVVKTYYSTGEKSAIVTVTSSNGQSQSKSCGNTVTVKSTYVAKAPTVVARQTPTPSPTPTPTSTPTVATSVLSLRNVPWGWVALLVILVLLGTIFYLIFNKKNM